MDDSENRERAYAIRFSPGADRELTEAVMRLVDLTGSEYLALEWLKGIRAAAAALATNPTRYQPQAPESRKLGGEIRRLLYQRTSSSSAVYHLYYRVDEDSDDGPRVRILHVRHAARKPLTRKEAREIQGAE